MLRERLASLVQAEAVTTLRPSRSLITIAGNRAAIVMRVALRGLHQHVVVGERDDPRRSLPGSLTIL
jgi:hypothetical protein